MRCFPLPSYAKGNSADVKEILKTLEKYYIHKNICRSPTQSALNMMKNYYKIIASVKSQNYFSDDLRM